MVTQLYTDDAPKDRMMRSANWRKASTVDRYIVSSGFDKKATNAMLTNNQLTVYKEKPGISPPQAKNQTSINEPQASPSINRNVINEDAEHNNRVSQVFSKAQFQNCVIHYHEAAGSTKK